MNELIGPLAALLVALCSPILIKPWLRRRGSFDVPQARSSHSVPTVRGGGIALLAGVVTALLVTIVSGTAAAELLLCMAVGLACGMLGWAEDWFGVAITVRLAVQSAVGVGFAALILHGGADWWWLPAAVLAVVVLVNAANFMDGVDTLTALSMSAIAVAWGTSALLWNTPWLLGAAGLLLCLFLAFLPWNIGGTGLFLGDSGSYLAGGLLASTLVSALVDGLVPWPVLIAPLIIYLSDTGLTLFERVVRGERWSQSHRRHHYHRLEDAGFSHEAIGGIVALGSVCATIPAMLIVLVDPGMTVLASLCVVAVGVAYLWFVRRLVGTASRSPINSATGELIE